ncbi:hypothetical protein PODOV084v1_p0047 [Vibrio phage 340E47.2]|nr:hypothetical protein PODOV084v1_p0047 [Vibrio phage 340E47.2]QZI91953.1 hypothetical protein PODOV077v1_p0042 [Vibrio phage 5P1a]
MPVDYLGFARGVDPSGAINTAAKLTELETLGIQRDAQQQDLERSNEQAKAAAANRKRIQELVPLIKEGDYDATIELTTLNPELSKAIQDAKVNENQAKTQATKDWIIGYMSAGDKEKYLQEENASIDLDNKFRDLDEEQRDIAVRTVSGGLFEKSQFENIFGSKEKDTRTATQKEYQQALDDGFEGSFLDYQKALKGSGGSSQTSAQKEYDQAVAEGYEGSFVDFKKEFKGGTTINLPSNKGDTEEQKQLAKNRANKYQTIQESAVSAESELFAISRLKQVDADIDTGFGLEFRADLARTINAFGGDGNKLLSVDPAKVQEFNSVAMRQVLDVMASQKGPQTDQDAIRIEKTVARAANEEEANKLILGSMEALARRKIEQEQFYTNYLDANDTIKGADKQWNEFKRKTPMFSEKVQNPQTKRPMYFYEFEELMRSRGHNNRDEIIESWQKLSGGQ